MSPIVSAIVSVLWTAAPTLQPTGAGRVWNQLAVQERFLMVNRFVISITSVFSSLGFFGDLSFRVELLWNRIDSPSPRRLFRPCLGSTR